MERGTDIESKLVFGDKIVHYIDGQKNRQNNMGMLKRTSRDGSDREVIDKLKD